MSKDIAKSDTAIMDFVGQVAGFGADGFENIDKKLIKLPFIKLAQALTPQLQEGPGQIKDLKPGQCFNSITGKVYGNQFLIIPIHLDESYIEWEGEGSNGKMVARFTPKEFETLKKSGDFVSLDGYKYNRNSNGNDIIQTYTFFVLLPEYADDGIMLLSFSKGGIKHVSKWITTARAMRWILPDGRSVPSPLYGCVWSLSTMQNKNDKGTWYAFGDKKIMTATRVGDLLEDKWRPLQKTVLDAFSYATANQSNVDVAEKDVTESDSGEKLVEV
jgi:hypothetical protein